MTSLADSTKSPKLLAERVRDWLQTEGYPLEFATAAVFRENGFRVWQGQHVKDSQAGAPREIDVLADQTIDIGGALVRLHHVVECKYSHDKPWVVFTSPAGRIGSAACIAQTIGSRTGDALLWAVAGDPTLHALDHFAIPERPGFGGRQAFSKGQDLVYSALQAVTSLSTLVVGRHGREDRPASESLKYAAVAFPVIVVDGELFEAFFEPATGSVEVREANRLRLHWRGSEAWPLHATVDIVRFSALPDFAKGRANEGKILIERLGQSLTELRESYTQGKPSIFGISKGSRGRVGAPQLLIDLQRDLQRGARTRKVISPGV